MVRAGRMVDRDEVLVEAVGWMDLKPESTTAFVVCACTGSRLELCK